MATRIESTVEDAAADLARAQLPGQRRVTMIVLDDQEEEAAVAELRRAIEAAESTEEVAGDLAVSELRANLARRYPASS